MSLNWRSVDLTKYEERLKTFHSWPITYINPKILAETGFFYTGSEAVDAVECFSCETALAYWEEGDDPQKEHENASPNCPFLLNRTEPLPNEGPPLHPDLVTFNARFETFESKWKYTHPKPYNLADAGFFYSGEGNKCECFYCGVVLKDWQITDEPWREHAYWSPGCNYVTLVKGIEYIDNICEHSSKIIPCGHIVSARCAPKMQACSECHSVIESTTRIIK